LTISCKSEASTIPSLDSTVCRMTHRAEGNTLLGFAHLLEKGTSGQPDEERHRVRFKKS
jgi:hypothetical protein